VCVREREREGEREREKGRSQMEIFHSRANLTRLTLHHPGLKSSQRQKHREGNRSFSAARNNNPIWEDKTKSLGLYIYVCLFVALHLNQMIITLTVTLKNLPSRSIAVLFKSVHF